MEQITKIHPAWDKRDKGYGIHGMEVVMVLKGQQGAVHFVWNTGILTKEVTNEFARTGKLNYENLSGDPLREHWFSVGQPMGYDVGTHTPEPQYPDQKVSVHDCDYLDGRPCYCDGSALLASEWFEIIRSEGSEKIWELLEERYIEEFGKLI